MVSGSSSAAGSGPGRVANALLDALANDTNATSVTTTTAPTATAGAGATSTVRFDPGPGGWESLCRWSVWSDWSPCSCNQPGVLRSHRQRTVLSHAFPATEVCAVLTSESKQCQAFCQAVHCAWGPWGGWSGCSKDCGGGERTRERNVYQHAARGGLPCAGPRLETSTCNASDCAHFVLGAWGCFMLSVCVILGFYIVWFRSRLASRKIVPTLQDEEEEADGQEPGGAWLEGVPDYWTNKRNVEASDFHEMVHVSRARHAYFEELLEATYVPRCTQDRPCPNGTCPKTPLGCPCARLGGTPGLPVGYRVRGVIRVESSGIWRRYAQKREEICSRRSSLDVHKFHPPLRGEGVVDAHPELFEPLDTFANEAYAFHGTSVRSALSIGREDYRIDLAGSGSGTMYGLGTYLAESCTKADEYAKGTESGPYKGVFAMLLSRVCMGRFFYTTQRDMQARHFVLSGEFDSTFGDREESAGTFREMVVYDRDQVYPEYILLYHRVHAGEPDGAAALARVHLDMQLPVYWRSCHRDLGAEDFQDQYRVRRATLRLLQRLADRSLVGEAWKLAGARRVENSVVWRRYCAYKDQLRLRLAAHVAQGGGPITPKETCGVLTSHYLRDPAFAEQVLSIDHLDSGVNEHLLWHGTSLANAESIAAHGFSIPIAREAQHGNRFGRGVYFAEELNKSLGYAAEKDGRCWVLLCRVACGRLYETDSPEEPEAHLRAREAGVDAVLAAPRGCGPREVVALEDNQIYPEYILELAPEQSVMNPPPPPPPPLPPDVYFEPERPTIRPPDLPGAFPALDID